MTPDDIRKLAEQMEARPLHVQEPHIARLLFALAEVVEAGQAEHANHDYKKIPCRVWLCAALARVGQL